MADKPETPKILDEITKAGANGSHRPAVKRNARRRLLIISLSLFCIVITVSYLSFQLRALQQELVVMGARYENLIVSMAEQNSRVQDLAAELDQYAGVETADRSLIEDIRSMNSEIEELKSQGLVQLTESDSYWNIREANFLLSLANRKLNLEKDIPSTIALIEDVDSFIVASGHRNVIPLRESLSRALSNLRAVGQIDTEGIFIRIESLKTAVEEIRVQGLQTSNNPVSGTTMEFEDIEYSAIGLSSLVTFLSNIFVWREWDHRSDLILMTDERAIAKQRLHLSLEHAQQGLLSQDGIVYKHSLMRAKDLFAMLGNENSVLGESLTAELEDLIMIKIDPEAPSLEGPLQLMNQLTLRFHDLK